MKGGGTHWTLLALYPQLQKVLRLDSSYGSEESARNVLAKVSQLLKLESSLEAQNISVPKQTNSYDCGVFVLMFAQALLSCDSEKVEDVESHVAQQVQEPHTVRERVKALI